MMNESLNLIEFFLRCVLLYNVAVIGYENNELFNFVFQNKLYIISVPRFISVLAFLYISKTYTYFSYICLFYKIVSINILKNIK
jgi:hypothetical protein